MYFKIILLLFVEHLFVGITYAQSYRNFFRPDYNYIEATESFYKLHTARKTWGEAKLICVREGARLFVSEDQMETDTVLAAYQNQTTFFPEIFVGISNLVSGSVFETVDGRPLQDVYNKWGPNEPNNANGDEGCVVMRKDGGALNDVKCSGLKPFICKKTLASLKWNDNCDMYDLDYVFVEETKSCYKFHRNVDANWLEASDVCATEFSHLVIINSDLEAKHLVQVMGLVPQESKYGGIVAIGFHNQFEEGWNNLDGKSLEESGYSSWLYGRVASDLKPGLATLTQGCGGMTYGAYLRAFSCSQRNYFMCEHEVKLESTALITDRLDIDDTE